MAISILLLTFSCPIKSLRRLGRRLVSRATSSTLGLPDTIRVFTSLSLIAQEANKAYLKLYHIEYKQTKANRDWPLIKNPRLTARTFKSRSSNFLFRLLLGLYFRRLLVLQLVCNICLQSFRFAFLNLRGLRFTFFRFRSCCFASLNL